MISFSCSLEILGDYSFDLVNIYNIYKCLYICGYYKALGSGLCSDEEYCWEQTHLINFVSLVHHLLKIFVMCYKFTEKAIITLFCVLF